VRAGEREYAVGKGQMRADQAKKYSLVDQMRRSSRSVTANLAEAWKKRRYEKAFISKLTDCASEAGETEVWLDFSKDLGYLSVDQHDKLMKYEKNYNDKNTRIL
jgi:four helix bundle protein